MTERYADTDTDEYNISASQVKTHSTCPLQYWFRYVEGKPASKKPSVYVKMGDRVHQTLEDLLGDDELPLDELDMLKTILREHYIEMEDPWLPEREYERGLECVEKAADVLHSRQPSVRDTEIRKEFELNRPDLSTGVTAKMDVVTENEVWDWKTGRVRPGETSHEETIQGTVYMAAYYAMYDEPPDAVRFIYLSPDARKRTDSSSDGPCARKVEPIDEEWNYMLKRAKALQRSKRENDFPANPGDHCYWCTYEYWCPEAPVGVGNVDWEDY